MRVCVRERVKDTLFLLLCEKLSTDETSLVFSILCVPLFFRDRGSCPPYGNIFHNRCVY